MAALGLNTRYLAFDVHPDQLKSAVAGARAMKFIGLNLTVPHKLLAVEIVDDLDESAATWGAVNTISFEAHIDDHWRALGQMEDLPENADIRTRGYNTDADAITRSLREDLAFDLPGAKVLLLGAGGAGRTAALKLASEGVAHLHLLNRTESKAAEVGKEIARRFPKVRVSVGYPGGPVDLVLNATSLGLKTGDGLPLDLRLFPLERSRYAYDMIYRPAETPFLQAARQAGCRTANGLGMLLYQGARALEIWTGQPAPIAPMREALIAHVYGGNH